MTSQSLLMAPSILHGSVSKLQVPFVTKKGKRVGVGLSSGVNVLAAPQAAKTALEAVAESLAGGVAATDVGAVAVPFHGRWAKRG